jgi:hypothetical protein
VIGHVSAPLASPLVRPFPYLSTVNRRVLTLPRYVLRMSSKYMLGSSTSPLYRTRACRLTSQADEVDGAVSAAEGVCAQASVPVPNTAVGDSPAPAATSTGSVSEDAEPTTATDSEGNAASSASSAVAGATSSVGSAASAATSAVA